MHHRTVSATAQVYSASKAAVVHFTRAMGLTLGEESNIRSVLPARSPACVLGRLSTHLHMSRRLGLTLPGCGFGRFFCLCPSYTATAQGPPVGQIKASVGGVCCGHTGHLHLLRHTHYCSSCISPGVAAIANTSRRPPCREGAPCRPHGCWLHHAGH